jgi:outer membrane protein OmpA-like peptidoglycan-associated protein
MIKFVGFIILLAISFSTRSQNLVINNSFEDRFTCNNLIEPQRPFGWYNVAKWAHNGYYPNIDGSTGAWNLEFIVGSDYRELRSYWETQLLQKLQRGKKYRIKLSVASTFGEGPNLNDIGFYFTDSMIFTAQRDTLLQPTNYIGFLGSKVAKPKGLWFRIEKEFTAGDNNQVLIVGNFSSKDYQKVVKDRNRNSKYITIHIDDIEIIPLEKNSCDMCQKIKDSLYAESKYQVCNAKEVETDTLITKKNLITKTDTVVINADILFASNSFLINNKDSLNWLKQRLISSSIEKIKIIGYTDSTGTDDYNKILSLKRAQAVGFYFINEFKIPSSKIEEIGNGISTKYSDLKSNRKVEILIYSK